MISYFFDGVAFIGCFHFRKLDKPKTGMRYSLIR